MALLAAPLLQRRHPVPPVRVELRAVWQRHAPGTPAQGVLPIDVLALRATREGTSGDAAADVVGRVELGDERGGDVSGVQQDLFTGERDVVARIGHAGGVKGARSP